MEIALEHRFAAPVAQVLSSLECADYGRWLASQHSFFAEVEMLSAQRHAGKFSRTVRYRARPFIARLGPFSLPAAWFTWVEHACLDEATGAFAFENVPELAHVRSKVINRGMMHFRGELNEKGQVMTVRSARFELGFEVASGYRTLASVALTMVARQLREALDEEAALLARWLAGEARVALAG
jgi:hypothetical protein